MTSTTSDCRFADDLLAPASKQDTTGWVRRHNSAVLDYIKARVGSRDHRLTRDERAILSLLDGIDQYVGGAAEYRDPFSGEYIVHELLTAVSNALNYPLGRLDGGTLSGWTMTMRERVGIDENGQWVGGA